MVRKERAKKDIISQIEKWQKDPEFIRAAYQFIRLHTGHAPSKSKSLK